MTINIEERTPSWYANRVRTFAGTNFPTSIQIELTSYCNAICFFCAHSWSKRPQEHMKPEMYYKIVDEVRSWPFMVNILYLTGLGEPLLHPNWRELFKYASGMPAAFTTNCSMIKESDIDFLLNLDFYEIAFSLDTLDDERHKKIRGFSVDRVAPIIEKIFARAKQLKTQMRLIISTTVTYDTVDDMKPMYDWLVPKMEGIEQARWHIKQIGAFPDVKALVQIMPPMDFLSKVKPLVPDHPQIYPIDIEGELRSPCTLWFDRVTLLSNGAPVPCCHQAHDYHNMLNVKDHSILDIFNSPKWAGYQYKFSLRDKPGGWSEIPYCEDCR